MSGVGDSEWSEDSGVQGIDPSAIIGYKYIRMEREKRDVRLGRERREARFGGERRDARCWRFGVVRGFRRPGSLSLHPSSDMYTCM
jgi:hypothetical protein